MSLLSTVTKFIFASSVATAQFAPVGLYNAPFIKGFGSNGTGWQVNNLGITSTAVTSDVLTLTDNGNNEARCAFNTTKQRFMNGFVVKFTYTPSGNKAADGIAFVVQNAAAGANALGGNGGSLGYITITNSLAIALNIYGAVGYKIGNNGSLSANNAVSVNLRGGNPIDIVGTYTQANKTLVLTLTDAVAGTSSSATVTSTDLVSNLGGREGYIGFCGGTGGAVATQKISNFSLTTL